MVAAPRLFGLNWEDSPVLIGVIGVVFFGACLGLIIWRLATSQGAVLSLSEAGVRDFRIAHELIAWSDIQRISEVRMRNNKFIVFTVRPELEQSLSMTKAAKWSRAPNKLLGIDGLCITAVGLNVRHKDLWEALQAYAAAQKIPSS
ncbi:hypothetical protein CW354_12630 [Marinicaulis flavus]|uniref:PH domain-containing protein n=2 Tax=Hyphococcus luteus TaxID=2058213 RepID=A0A2S7K453_9PROT|nr:hypothetical protein CW354_12630 [Marinicaulis flavus]